MTQDQAWQQAFEWGKYAILVINKEGKIVHSVLYPNPPSIEDKLELREELATDEEFGLIGEDDLYFMECDEEKTIEWKNYITNDTETKSRGS